MEFFYSGKPIFMTTKIAEPKTKPRPAWSVRMDKLMTARGIDQPELLKIMIGNGFQVPADRLAFENLLSTWRRGRSHKPRDDNALEHVARALGTTFRELMFGSGRGDDTAVQVLQQDRNFIMAEGEKIDVNRLEPNQANVIAAAMAGRQAEVWQLTSDVISGAGYHQGDFVIVDLAQRPRPGQFVLAESSRAPIFRQFFPPGLYCVSLGAQVEPIIYDNVKTTIRGVISSKLSV